MTHRDMAEIIQHALMRQDAVGDHQIAEEPVQILGHAIAHESNWTAAGGSITDKHSMGTSS
jgi:hypothetical protein